MNDNKNRFIAAMAAAVAVLGYSTGAYAVGTPSADLVAAGTALTDFFTGWAVTAGLVTAGAIAVGLAFWGIPQVITLGKVIFKRARG